MQVTLNTTHSAHWAAARGLRVCPGPGPSAPRGPTRLPGKGSCQARSGHHSNPRPAGLPNAFDTEELASETQGQAAET